MVHSHTFLPIFAGAKQTHLPGDETKANSKVKDSLDLHLTLPKHGLSVLYQPQLELTHQSWVITVQLS